MTDMVSICTARLLLRPMHIDDFDAYRELMMSPRNGHCSAMGA